MALTGTLGAGFCGHCPDCGKRRYSSRAQAKRAARANRCPGRRLRAYRCGGWWHLTSRDAGTVTYYRERRTAWQAKP